jgi:hypothetical protein
MPDPTERKGAKARRLPPLLIRDAATAVTPASIQALILRHGGPTGPPRSSVEDEVGSYGR